MWRLVLVFIESTGGMIFASYLVFWTGPYRIWQLKLTSKFGSGAREQEVWKKYKFMFAFRISPQTTGWMPIGMRVLMEFFVHYLPSLRISVDVYGWYTGLTWALHVIIVINPPSWAQNAGGKTGAKILPCVRLANSCQLARRGILKGLNITRSDALS